MKSKFCKEACQRCFGEKDTPWTEYDDRCWKVGYLWCMSRAITKSRTIVKTEKIPKGCQYRLEHIVMGKNK